MSTSKYRPTPPQQMPQLPPFGSTDQLRQQHLAQQQAAAMQNILGQQSIGGIMGMDNCRERTAEERARERELERIREEEKRLKGWHEYMWQRAALVVGVLVLAIAVIALMTLLFFTAQPIFWGITALCVTFFGTAGGIKWYATRKLKELEAARAML